MQRTRMLRLSRAIGLAVAELTDRFRQAVHRQGPIVGALDLPGDGQTVAATLQVGGWAISSRGPVERIQVLLDDDESELGLVPYGVNRLDVVTARPWQREVNCGYAGEVSLRSVLPGPHVVRVRVIDARGNARDFARTILVSGARVEQSRWSGNTLSMRGWVLWPGESNPRSAQVFVNDRPMGVTRVNLSTPDVQALFPGRSSASRCGFSFTCDLNAPKESTANRPVDLMIRLVDSEGREMATSVSVCHESGPASQVDSELLKSVAEAIARFQAESGRDPTILDCCTGTELAAAFPQYSVFSPPAQTPELPRSYR